MLVSTMGTPEPGRGVGDGTGDSTGEGWSAEVDVEPVVSGAPALGLVNAGEPGVEAALPHATINTNIAATASGQADKARKGLTTFLPCPLTKHVPSPL